jgi:hypothetical protein
MEGSTTIPDPSTGPTISPLKENAFSFFFM